MTTEQVIMIGAFTLPVVLTVVMAVIYRAFPKIPDRFRALVATGVGLLLGLVALAYSGADWTVHAIIQYAVAGIMAGGASIGVYETARTFYRPRSG